MNNINWREVHQHLSLLQKQDAKAYRIASIVFLVLALVPLFFFPFASIVFLIVAGYLYYNYSKGSTGGNEVLIEVTVTKKSSYFQLSVTPDEETPKSYDSPSMFIFTVKVKNVFAIQPDGIKKAGESKLTRLKVNQAIYKNCNVGMDYNFIMSSTGDLLGFVNEQKVQFLTKKINGKEYSTSLNQIIDFNNTQLCSEETA
jgi:hypothetical protein